MEKSNIMQGQMVLYYNPTFMDKPMVWVKVDDTQTEPSLFIDNNAMVRFSINPNHLPDISEQWKITDRFYGKMVREGKFVPIDDLNQADRITEELGWPAYVIDF